MMKKKEYIQLENQYGAFNYKPLDIILSQGKGVWVWDTEGKKYLDCLSSYSAINQGHCHPKITQALIEQSQKLQLTSRAFRNDQLGLFYQEICGLTGYEKVLPMNSGAEAVETALKLARKWGHQTKKIQETAGEIIVCENNFHGRTITIISFSSDPHSKKDFGPYTPGFVTIPYNDIDALKKMITPHTIAFLVEPIQGEAGVNIPSPGFLKQAAQICQENKILLILDEIQTGLGRTGKLFAQDYEEIRADITIVGKALSGGAYPVSAVLSSQKIMNLFQPGEHGSTFGGNPLACAVARAALNVLIHEKLIENAYSIGNYFLKQLQTFTHPVIKEIRGKGLLIAIELKKEAGGARKYCEKLQEYGILCKETHDHIIRIAPPLIITQEEVDWALERINRVLKEKPD